MVIVWVVGWGVARAGMWAPGCRFVAMPPPPSPVERCALPCQDRAPAKSGRRRLACCSVLWSGGGKRVEDVGGSVAEVTVGGGDVGAAAEPDDVDRGVAQGGH